MRLRMWLMIFSPSFWLSSLSPWCLPVRALSVSARPMKPTLSVPWRSTSSTLSSGPSLSESIHTPWPIRKGVVVNLLAALDLEAVQQLAHHQVHAVVQHAEERVRSPFASMRCAAG